MKLKTIRIGYDSFGWILETLRDPLRVWRSRATPRARPAACRRRGAADAPAVILLGMVRRIVEELHDLEPEIEAAMIEAQLIEVESIAAMMYDLLGTNLDADTLGFTAADVLEMFNKYAAGKYPNGHRELY